jgi:hypothetical protein
MTTIRSNKLFIDINTKKLMSLSKYKINKRENAKMGITPFYTTYSLKLAAIQKLVRSKMEINKVARFALNSTIALKYYFPTASNEESITTLVEKDIEPQKEKVEKFITFEKKNLKKIWNYQMKILNMKKNIRKCLKMKNSKN